MQSRDASGLDGRLLKLFLSIYDSNSVSRAAEEFDLNQSTVSHNLEKLRRGLGDPLFVKSGRGITPTVFAIELVPRVREIVALLEGLSTSETYDPRIDGHPITIATNATELLPELIKMRDIIGEHAPHAQLRFLELGSRENVEPILESGKADLVVTARMAAYPSSLLTSSYVCDPHVCFFDAEVRKPPRTIKQYSAARHAVLDFGGSRKSTVALALEQQSVSRSIALMAPNAQVLGQLIKGTDLVVTMQSRLLASAFNGLATCRPPVALPDVCFDLVWHRCANGSARSRWLRDVAEAAVR